MKTLLDFRPQIEAALGGDKRWTADDILLLVLQGKMQLWEDELGICLTEILVTREKRLLVFLMTGEKPRIWRDRMTKRLAEFAKAQGCTCIEAYCRPGLEHVLKEGGWKREQVVMRYRL